MSGVEKALVVVAVGALGYFAYTKFSSPTSAGGGLGNSQGGIGSNGTSPPRPGSTLGGLVDGINGGISAGKELFEKGKDLFGNLW